MDAQAGGTVLPRHCSLHGHNGFEADLPPSARQRISHINMSKLQSLIIKQRKEETTESRSGQER